MSPIPDDVCSRTTSMSTYSIICALWLICMLALPVFSSIGMVTFSVDPYGMLWRQQNGGKLLYWHNSVADNLTVCHTVWIRFYSPNARTRSAQEHVRTYMLRTYSHIFIRAHKYPDTKTLTKPTKTKTYPHKYLSMYAESLSLPCLTAP